MAQPTGGEYRGRSWALVLLIIPFIALLWLPFYAHYDPTVLGVPFFYWYQFLWVIIGVIITAFGYLIVSGGE